MLYAKLKTLFFDFHKTYKHQTWQDGDLGRTVSTY